MSSSYQTDCRRQRMIYAFLFAYSVPFQAEVEKVVDSASLTRRKYFQKLGLTENIWENIMI